MHIFLKTLKLYFSLTRWIPSFIASFQSTFSSQACRSVKSRHGDRTLILLVGLSSSVCRQNWGRWNYSSFWLEIGPPTATPPSWRTHATTTLVLGRLTVDIANVLTDTPPAESLLFQAGFIIWFWPVWRRLSVLLITLRWSRSIFIHALVSKSVLMGSFINYVCESRSKEDF
jgi:hypothetical protein